MRALSCARIDHNLRTGLNEQRILLINPSAAVLTTASTSDPYVGPSDASEVISVVVVGNQPLVRAGLRALLAETRDVRVVGEMVRPDAVAPPDCGNGCNVALFDDHGLATTPRCAIASLRGVWPNVPVLALVQSGGYAAASEWIRAGAQGLMARDDAPAQLAIAVRKLAGGELWLGRLTSARLIRELAAEQRQAVSEAMVRKAATLSTRERQVVGLITRGCSNKLIAHELAISENTVRRHLSSIFTKLGVPDRLALALCAHGDSRFASLQ